MRFQNRDGEILKSIYENEGVLAKRHIKQMFWLDKTWRAMERRLSLLRAEGYINWPSREEYNSHPIPEPICWLDWKGVLYIAGKNGIVVESFIEKMRIVNENRRRDLQKKLRDQGIRWVRHPRWSLLAHDIAVVDFRLALERSIGELPSISLEKWIPESVFRSRMDVVVYEIKDRSGNLKKIKKGICPDAYFEITNEVLKSKGKPHRMRFLLELDMATHDNPSFGREKATPGAVYIGSPAYEARFGSSSGYWLVVAHAGHIRLKNLMRQTKKRIGNQARLFLFALLDSFTKSNVLTSSVWHQVDRGEPGPLIKF